MTTDEEEPKTLSEAWDEFRAAVESIGAELLAAAVERKVVLKGNDIAGGTIDEIQAVKGGEPTHLTPVPGHVEVVLFKTGGKYYTTEQWKIPPGALGPWSMIGSEDFRRIDGKGKVLVPSQDPWGYPHLI